MYEVSMKHSSYPRLEADEVCTHRCENILKITAFVSSLILLTVAVIASLVCTGFLTETFSLYSLRYIGQLGASIFLTLSFLSTVVLGIILIKSCIHLPPDTPGSSNSLDL